MYEFTWPWMFALLPLPLLVWWLFPRESSKRDAALKVPIPEEFRMASGTRLALGRNWLLIAVATIVWVLIVTASARPVWLGEADGVPVGSRNMLLAVDLSGSMRTQDFTLRFRQVNRLDAAKWVVGEFIEDRKGDRMGLVLFGTRAYFHVPLTFDTKTLRTLLDESFIGMAGSNTAIGDAIGVSIKQLVKQKEGQRVLILLTDGHQTAGMLEPLEAAAIAKKANIRIYTVGIGAVRFGGSADLNVEELKKIANMTGGKFFLASNTRELKRIYKYLDALEPVDKDQWFRPTKEMFYVPLAFAFMLCCAYITYLLYMTRGVA
jgi:Ca-activated chloride channel family protein